jgi:hypothetical protein
MYRVIASPYSNLHLQQSVNGPLHCAAALHSPSAQLPSVATTKGMSTWHVCACFVCEYVCAFVHVISVCMYRAVVETGKWAAYEDSVKPGVVEPQ